MTAVHGRHLLRACARTAMGHLAKKASCGKGHKPFWRFPFRYGCVTDVGFVKDAALIELPHSILKIYFELNDFGKTRYCQIGLVTCRILICPAVISCQQQNILWSSMVIFATTLLPTFWTFYLSILPTFSAA